MLTAFEASEILWLTIELNPLRKYQSQSQPKTLVDLSSEKLISDVSLISQTALNIPKKIFSVLLDKAIVENRILSVYHLVKYCPYESIEVSTSRALGDLSTIKENRNIVKDDFKKFCDIRIRILTAFFDVISENRSISKLKTLNLGFVQLGKWMPLLLKDFIKRTKKNVTKLSKNVKVLECNPTDAKKLCTHPSRYLESGEKLFDFQESVLKCSVLIETGHDINDILKLYLSARAIGFKLIITGVCLCNNLFRTSLISEIFKLINMQDFQMLSLRFAEFHPSPQQVFTELKNFRFLKYLNMSYMRNPFIHDGSLLREFSVSLNTLLHLKRLVFEGIKLTGCLSYIFNEFCKRKLDASIATDCCLGHCGSLEYLDVSGCYLKDEDIVFLKDLQAFKSIKYLDISENFLRVKCTLQTLLHFSSSLLLLNMANCFGEATEYNSETFPLRAFTQIRFLNIKGMKITDKEMLLTELKNMTFEYIETDGEPPFDALSYEQFTILCSLQI